MDRRTITAMGSPLEFVSVAASVATALGVFLAAGQLYLTSRQAVTQFEDQLAGQYREVARRLPLEALLGETLDEDTHQRALSDFYDYFDLSNEQAFLKKQGRISPTTWANWLEGIHQNLRRPAFARAWQEVRERAPDSFNELREIVGPHGNLRPALPTLDS
jgi:hypothetical protein